MTFRLRTLSLHRQGVISLLAAVLALVASPLGAQEVHRDLPYHLPPVERKVLDVSMPADAAARAVGKRPIVFWIHGGGWQGGDKSDVGVKPRAFTDRGLVFVSTNYRLLPNVDMETLVRDVAEAVGWVRDHAAEYGGDPDRIFLMGHSAGAQIAAILCTDDRYLKSAGVPLSSLVGCVPVDGDTYDVPAIIETGETRRRVHGQPQPTFGHRQKFGDDPRKHVDLSAVTHVRADKGIPPFLILHVAGGHDTTAQAHRLSTVLKEAGIAATVFAAPETTHRSINENLGVPGDAVTKAVFDFVDSVLAARAEDRR
jgi:arylformamidase